MTSLKGKFLCGFGLAVMVFLLLPVIAPSQSQAFLNGKIKSFSADYVSLSPQGSVQSTSRIYVIPGAMRMDGLISDQKTRGIKANVSVLSLRDRHEAYMINNDKKIYASMDFDDKSMGIKTFKDAKVIKVLGKERVSGYDCVKKQVSWTYNMMGMTMTNKATIWVSERFDMPLRTKGGRGLVTELRNIKPGTPDKAHFRLPAGYRKVDNVITVMDMDDRQHTGHHVAGSRANNESPLPDEEAIKNLKKALQNFQHQFKNGHPGQK